MSVLHHVNATYKHQCNYNLLTLNVNFKIGGYTNNGAASGHFERRYNGHRCLSQIYLWKTPVTDKASSACI